MKNTDLWRWDSYHPKIDKARRLGLSCVTAVAVSLRPNEFFLNQTFLCNEVHGDFAELSRAASTSSTILWATTSGSRRLSDSLRVSFLSRKISRLGKSY